MKRYILLLILTLAFFSTDAQKKHIYHSAGNEIIFSGADINFNGTDVNNNIRFTLFFHTQQQINFDLTDNIGLYTGFAIRNVGLIMEDYFQNVGYAVDNTHPDYNKNTKVKHRSYSLGFPVAVKLGSFSKNYFFFAGGEYEWMFHYKQKKFIDGEPMNPATNKLSGLSYKLWGVSSCWRIPWFITAMRVAMVIAST